MNISASKHIIMTGNKFYENVARFKYYGKNKQIKVSLE
jgi:hypothetical protein